VNASAAEFTIQIIGCKAGSLLKSFWEKIGSFSHHNVRVSATTKPYGLLS